MQLHQIVSEALLIFLVLDPFGNIPLFSSLLAGVGADRRRTIIVRENLIALAVLLLFFFAGAELLRLLRISEPALTIAGGLILFLIALRMIFSNVEEIFGKNPEGEPFVVPLAIPMLAGPSALTTVLLLRAREVSPWGVGLASLLVAWLASGLFLLASGPLSRRLGERGLTAVNRLMGMLLTTIAVQMFLEGFTRYWRTVV